MNNLSLRMKIILGTSITSVLKLKSVNTYMEERGYICLKNMASVKPPKYLPTEVEDIFNEGSTCLSVNCYNAAATMFRLCIDFATNSLLPAKKTEGLNAETRRVLGHRLKWLFDNKYLPETLRELSQCIKDDGNDGAHRGTLKKEDAEDLLDFTYEILERIYTDAKKLQIAKERRDARRRK